MKQKKTNKEDKRNLSWKKEKSRGIVGSDPNLYTGREANFKKFVSLVLYQLNIQLVVQNLFTRFLGYQSDKR
jgi:hypothetical protein